MPRRRRLLPSGAACALIAMFAFVAHARAQGPPSSPTGVLAAYAAADDAGKNALLQQHLHEASALVHALLVEATDERAGTRTTTLGPLALELARDLAAKYERMSGVATLSDDVAAVAGLGRAEISDRSRILGSCTAARSHLAELLRRKSPEDERAAARREVKDALGDARRFAENHDDRDLLRAAAHLRVEAARLLAPGMTEPGPTERARALESLAALYADHGLDGDAFYFLAEVEVAGLHLSAGLVPQAEAAAHAARRSAKRCAFPPDHLAHLLSLELELHRARGFDTAALATLDEFEKLLPALRDAAATSVEPRFHQMVSDWSFQVGAFRGLAGDHARALRIHQEGLTIPGQRPGQRLRRTLHLALESEILGRYEDCVPLADEVLAGLPSLDAASPEAGFAHLIEIRAQLVAARAALRLGSEDRGRRHLELAATAIATAHSNRRAVPPVIAAEAALADGLYAAADGDLEAAVRTNDGVLTALASAPPSTEAIQALWAKAKALLALGEDEQALRTVELARTAATEAPFDRAALRFETQLLHAEILLGLGRPAEAGRSLDRLLADDDEPRPERAARRGLAERLRVEARFRLWKAAGRREPEALKALVADAESAIRDLERAPVPTADVIGEIQKAFGLVQEIEIESGRDPCGRRALGEATRAFDEALRRDPRLERTLAGREARASRLALEGRTAECEKRREDAVAAYREAARFEDRLREQLRFRAPDGLSARFESLHDRIAGLLLEAAAEFGDQARASEALAYLEEVRARSLRTRLGSRRAGDDDDGVSRGQEPGTGRFAPSRLVAEVPPDRVVLSYALTGRGAFVAVARGGEVRVVALSIDRDALERTANAIRRNLEGSPDPAKARALAADLARCYEQLVRPIEGVLASARELVVVPHGAIQALPFAALLEAPFEPGDDFRDFRAARFLAERPGLEAITLVPSLGVLARIEAAPRGEPEKDVLLVGDPATGDAGLPRLPFARAEIDAVARLFDPAKSTLLVGDDASRSRVVAARPGAHGILHVATHGRPRAGNRGAPDLVLAPEAGRVEPSLFTREDVEGLDLSRTRLVVLGTCLSSRSRSAGFEGAIGLPRAFLASGVRDVVASSTEVQDASAAEVLAAFYRELAARPGSPAAALLRAFRARCATLDGSWPGAWASFVVVGMP